MRKPTIYELNKLINELGDIRIAFDSNISRAMEAIKLFEELKNHSTHIVL